MNRMKTKKLMYTLVNYKMIIMIVAKRHGTISIQVYTPSLHLTCGKNGGRGGGEVGECKMIESKGLGIIFKLNVSSENQMY